MPVSHSRPVPGTYSTEELPRRPLVWIGGSERVVPGGAVMDAAARDHGHAEAPETIRAGWLLGRNAATGRFGPCKRTRTGSGGNGTTQVTVDDASAFRVGDVIEVGGDSGLTVTAADYAGSRLTVDVSVTYTADEAVRATDGTATAVGILGATVAMQDADGAARHRPITLLVGGGIDDAYVLGDLAAARDDAAAALHGFLFRTDHV